jgi:hypothetical protein
MRVVGLASNSAGVWSVGSCAACGGTLRGEGCGTVFAHHWLTVDKSRKDSHAFCEILPAWLAPSGIF